MFLLTAYFAMLAGVVWIIEQLFPWLARHLPFGGIDAARSENLSSMNDMEIVQTIARNSVFSDFEGLTLALATMGAVLLMLPISWVYFITTSDKRIDRSFVQTVMVLPVIVAGIASIVQHSLALAFSLAGIVAAVRLRFTLSEPASALYIFVAIAVGLAAGISALGMAYVSTLGFVYLSLALWRFNYGANLNTSFFAFLTSRGHDDKEL